MKKALLLVVVFIMACGGGGGNNGGFVVGGASPVPVTPPEISKYVVMGDSMAVGLARVLPESECAGTAGTVDSLLLYYDRRLLNNAVLFIGINSITDDESQNIDQLCINYSKLVMSIKATGKLFCVGVPKVSDYPHRWKNIEILNAHIKATCGVDSYIDTWEMENTFTDGLHPDEAMNRLIADEIVRRTGI